MTKGRLRKNEARRGEERGDTLYTFEWANGDGTIGSAIAGDLRGAKKELWAKLKVLEHQAVMKDLRRGKKYRVFRVKIP